MDKESELIWEAYDSKFNWPESEFSDREVAETYKRALTERNVNYTDRPGKSLNDYYYECENLAEELLFNIKKLGLSYDVTSEEIQKFIKSQNVQLPSDLDIETVAQDVLLRYALYVNSGNNDVLFSHSRFIN